MLKPQLCLGTAQFGQAYGITNASGQLPEAVVSQLLIRSASLGIRWLDTAQAYGRSESVLGLQLPASHSFQIISKLRPQLQAAFNVRDLDRWEQAFASTCRRLGVPSLHALLLHQPGDLRKPGGHILVDWLLSLRERGLVERLGVSIYAADDLEGVHPSLLDLVQLPLSLFDQRLLHDGTMSNLRSRGVAIHARSLYLQGLLLTPAAQWPTWVAPDVRAHQQGLEAVAHQKGCRLIDLVLGFAQAQSDLEAVVVGLCSIRELDQLHATWSAPSPWQLGEWRGWSLSDLDMIDPRRWPR